MCWSIALGSGLRNPVQLRVESNLPIGADTMGPPTGDPLPEPSVLSMSIAGAAPRPRAGGDPRTRGRADRACGCRIMGISVCVLGH